MVSLRNKKNIPLIIIKYPLLSRALYGYIDFLSYLPQAWHGTTTIHTFVSPSTDSRGAVVSFCQKYVHEVLVNCLGGLSLPRKSGGRLTDCPDMT